VIKDKITEGVREAKASPTSKGKFHLTAFGVGINQQKKSGTHTACTRVGPLRKLVATETATKQAYNVERGGFCL